MQAIVPAGSCAVGDVATILVAADRYGGAGCPPAVDPFGMYLATEPHTAPGASAAPPPELTAWWRRTLDAADHVVLSVDGSDFVAWTPELRAWFGRTFAKAGSHHTQRISRLWTDGVVETPNGAHFTSCTPDYERDEAFQKEYAASAASPEAWAQWRADWVDIDEADYQRKVAAR